MLNVSILGRGYAWLDTGTIESLFDASNFVKTIEEAQGLSVAVPEEIAYTNGWISKDELAIAAHNYGNSGYGRHLSKVINNEIYKK